MVPISQNRKSNLLESNIQTSMIYRKVYKVNSSAWQTLLSRSLLTTSKNL